VLEPFGGAPAWSMALARFAADQDVTLVQDERARVLPHKQAIVMTSGARRRYDRLLVAVAERSLRLADGRSVDVDHVVAVPRAAGRFLERLPYDADGFVPVDAHGRFEGVECVYTAGDVTSFPLKQGGLATQQADAAAEGILADLGLPLVPRRFTPVLEGVLFTGGDPAFMRRPLGADDAPAPRSYSLWWPPSKIAGRLLSSYLAAAGAPRAPEIRPADVVPVSIEVSDAGRLRPRTPAAC
jgi:NADH dehydrogenase FAD-containing subunit